MQWGVLQALNSLSNFMTFIAIVEGRTQGKQNVVKGHFVDADWCCVKTAEHNILMVSLLHGSSIILVVRSLYNIFGKLRQQSK